MAAPAANQCKPAILKQQQHAVSRGSFANPSRGLCRPGYVGNKPRRAVLQARADLAVRAAATPQKPSADHSHRHAVSVQGLCIAFGPANNRKQVRLPRSPLNNVTLHRILRLLLYQFLGSPVCMLARCSQPASQALSQSHDLFWEVYSPHKVVPHCRHALGAWRLAGSAPF